LTRVDPRCRGPPWYPYDGDEQNIIAYLVPVREYLDAGELRARADLPEYSVPAAFVMISALPRPAASWIAGPAAPVVARDARFGSARNTPQIAGQDLGVTG
jgi:hypothetical protein